MVVMFDLDGVLLDSEVPIKLLWRRLLPTVSTSKFSILWERCLGVNQQTECQTFQTLLGWTIDQYLHFIHNVQALSPSHFPLRQGVISCLHHLRQMGVEVAIVTSRNLRELPEIMNPEDWNQLRAACKLIVTGDMGLASKPDPAPYLFAIKTLQVFPEDCLVIEDAPNGIESALLAGATVVALEDTVSHDITRYQKPMVVLSKPLINDVEQIIRCIC